MKVDPPSAREVHLHLLNLSKLELNDMFQNVKLLRCCLRRENIMWKWDTFCLSLIEIGNENGLYQAQKAISASFPKSTLYFVS